MPRVWWYQRRYVFQMNVLVAVGVGSVCAMYGHLRWWSIAPAAAVLLALELALLSPRTAWFSIVVGTACSAVGGFVAGVAVAASQTNRHDVWWIAGALGVVVGAWLMLDAHRTLRRDRELTARGRSSPSP